VSVSVAASLCVRLFVCVYARKRERERARNRKRERKRERARENACVCVCSTGGVCSVIGMQQQGCVSLCFYACVPLSLPLSLSLCQYVCVSVLFFAVENSRPQNVDLFCLLSRIKCVAVYCSLLQRAAMCCILLQCVALTNK